MVRRTYANDSAHDSGVNATRTSSGIGAENRSRPGRFTLLLVSILLFLAVDPLITSYVPLELFLTMTITTMLVVSLYSMAQVYFVLGLVLLVPVFVCKWALLFSWSSKLEIVNAVSSALLLTLIVSGLVTRLFTIKRVTFDAISAAICAYLLMGLAWAFVVTFVAQVDPTAFSIPWQTSAPGAKNALPLKLELESAPAGWDLMRKRIYYSFECLTTLGFGDITPLSSPARALSILEAISGQLYMAILIARLVGLQVVQSLKED